MQRPDLGNSLDYVAAAGAAAAVAGTLWTFAVGGHYIIPTAILVLAVLLGNLARYALAGRRWAREILFWIGAVFTAHSFFALFFAKTPKALLGAAFEPVCGAVFLLSAFAVTRYAQRNRLFTETTAVRHDD